MSDADIFISLSRADRYQINIAEVSKKTGHNLRVAANRLRERLGESYRLSLNGQPDDGHDFIFELIDDRAQSTTGAWLIADDYISGLLDFSKDNLLTVGRNAPSPFLEVMFELAAAEFGNRLEIDFAGVKPDSLVQILAAVDAVNKTRDDDKKIELFFDSRQIEIEGYRRQIDEYRLNPNPPVTTHSFTLSRGPA